MYLYNIICLQQKSSKYWSFSIKASSFIEAVNIVFKEDSTLLSIMFDIYCIRPLSGDMQHMAFYDGEGSFMDSGEIHSHLLTLSNGYVYTWNGNEFVKEIMGRRYNNIS